MGARSSHRWLHSTDDATFSRFPALPASFWSLSPFALVTGPRYVNVRQGYAVVVDVTVVVVVAVTVVTVVVVVMVVRVTVAGAQSAFT